MERISLHKSSPYIPAALGSVITILFMILFVAIIPLLSDILHPIFLYLVLYGNNENLSTVCI